MKMHRNNAILPFVLLWLLFGCSSRAIRIIECIDNDGDGYAVGCDDTSGYAGIDCDDHLPTCTVDCFDDNNNGQPDCAEEIDACVDEDDDGYAVDCDDLSGYLGRDCDDQISICTVDCEDGDGDGLPDCAQVAGSEWIIGLDGALSHSRAYDLIEVSSGDLVVLGEADSGNQYRTDTFIVRLDRRGAVVWSRRYGSQEHDRGRAVIEDRAGELVLAGINGERPWAAKIDGEGNFIWQVALQGAGVGEFEDVVELPEGGYLFAGSVISQDGHRRRALLVSFDALGNIEWQHTLESSGESFVHSLAVSPLGDIYVVGVARSTLHDSSSDDAWVARLSPDGEILWQRALGEESSEQYGHGVAVLDESIVVVGASTLWLMAGETWHLQFDRQGELTGGIISSFHAGDGIGRWTSLHSAGYSITALEDQFLGASLRGVPLSGGDNLWEIVLEAPEEAGEVSIQSLTPLSDGHFAAVGAFTSEHPFWEQAFISVMVPAWEPQECDLIRSREDISAVSLEEYGEIPIHDPELVVTPYDAVPVVLDVAELLEVFESSIFCD